MMLEVTDERIACWRVNYGLATRTPEDAAQWWSDAMNGMAPAGAVAALGIVLDELEALRADACRYRFMRTRVCATEGCTESEADADVDGEMNAASR